MLVTKCYLKVGVVLLLLNEEKADKSRASKNRKRTTTGKLNGL